MAHAGGRRSKLNGHTIELAEEYVDDIPANVLDLSDDYLEGCKDKFDRKNDIKEAKLPTDFGLALYLGVSRSTLYEWEKKNQKFAAVLERLNNRQADELIQKSLSGHYKSQKTVGALLSKHGIVEKTETDNAWHFNDTDKADNFMKDD